MAFDAVVAAAGSDNPRPALAGILLELLRYSWRVVEMVTAGAPVPGVARIKYVVDARLCENFLGRNGDVETTLRTGALACALRFFELRTSRPTPSIRGAEIC